MEKWVSRDNQNAIRAIAAIGIMYTHMGATIDSPNNILWFSYIGYLCVGIFFFYTGYNLIASVSNKWINHFLINKCKRIYIPFVVANIIYIILQSITGEFDTTKVDLIKDIFGLHLINPTLWYVVSIILYQLIFFLLAIFSRVVQIKTIQQFVKSKYGILILIIISWILYAKVYPRIATNIGAVCNENERFPICLILGALFYCIESTIFDIVKKYKLELMAILSLLLCIIHGNNMQHNELWVGLFNLYDYLPPVLTALLLNVYICGEQHEGKILRFLGNISYEIYLLHMAVLLFFRSKIININNDYIYIIIYTVTLLVSSYLIKRALDKLYGLKLLKRWSIEKNKE